MAMPDSDMERLPAFIDCVVGMPLMVTHNICKPDGIVNGTVGKLHSITFPRDTRFTEFHDTDMDTIVLVADQQADIIVVSLDQPKHLPLPGCAPELYAFTPVQKTVMNFKPRPNDSAIPICIRQFPLVSASSVTVYKVQGDTLDGLIVGNWTGPRKNSFAQAYVTVSRVKSRSCVAVLKQFTEDDAHYFHPPPATLDEDLRLQAISDTFVNNFRKANS
jgi:hypothetical protein